MSIFLYSFLSSSRCFDCNKGYEVDGYEKTEGGA